MSMQPQKDTKSLLMQAISNVNDQIRSAGYKKIHISFVEATKLAADAKSPSPREIFKLVCKEDGRMLGIAPKKLSNIFIEIGQGNFYTAATDADHLSGSQFDALRYSEANYEECIRTHLEDVAGIPYNDLHP